MSSAELTTKRRVGVRRATLQDAPRLQKIYDYYVADPEVVVSFETVAPDVAEFETRMSAIGRDFPYFVYEAEDGAILGYAYAHKCFERAAYRWDVETTIYLARDARGRGVGRALYGALIDALGALGYKSLYAVIVSENEESCKFHERMGFRLFALFRRTGWKSGRWLDVAWYELQLGEFATPPKEPTSFSELPENVVDSILARANESIQTRGGDE